VSLCSRLQSAASVMRRNAICSRRRFSGCAARCYSPSPCTAAPCRRRVAPRATVTVRAWAKPRACRLTLARCAVPPLLTSPPCCCRRRRSARDCIACFGHVTRRMCCAAGIPAGRDRNAERVGSRRKVGLRRRAERHRMALREYVSWQLLSSPSFKLCSRSACCKVLMCRRLVCL
jgi:hypothetical protein